MSPQAPPLPIRRILAALDASPPSLAALEFAVTLAASVDAELEALFVEDTNLLRLGERPGARGVGSFSGSVRFLDPASVALHLRAGAGLAREAVAASAGQAGVRWSFRIARGRVTDVVAEASVTADVVSIGRVGWAPGLPGRIGATTRALLRAPRSAALVLSRLRRGRPVCVVTDGSAPGREALRLAAALARRERVPLAVLLAAGGPENGERLRRETAALIEPAGLERVRFHTLAARSPAAILRVLEREAAGALVLPAGIPWLEEENLVALLAGTPLPVLRIALERAP